MKAIWSHICQIIQQKIIVHNNWRIYKIRLLGEVMNDRHLKETIKRKRLKSWRIIIFFRYNCFYLFVAGWRKEADALSGHHRGRHHAQRAGRSHPEVVEGLGHPGVLWQSLRIPAQRLLISKLSEWPGEVDPAWLCPYWTGRPAIKSEDHRYHRDHVRLKGSQLQVLLTKSPKIQRAFIMITMAWSSTAQWPSSSWESKQEKRSLTM